jgi:ribosomal protein S18 acetylase RimI-like enzyme
VAHSVADTTKFHRKHPERLPTTGIAVASDGTPLGYVQTCTHPMNDKDGLHDTKPGETYIEQLSVGAAARGKGIGKLLLQWAEKTAREKNSTVLTLSVLKGNPARRLYERFGFRAKPAGPCEDCVNGCVVLFLVERPYGLCDPHCGTTDMEKVLAS